MARRLAVVLAAVLALALPALRAPLAHASSEGPGIAGLEWAEAHAAGCWYDYGGTSCSPGYDCSGLVSTAIYDSTGIWVGRTTYDMASSRYLHRVSHPMRGGLAMMYNKGHVEFITRHYAHTFGAHDSGSRVGWFDWHSWPSGTQFYSVW